MGPTGKASSLDPQLYYVMYPTRDNSIWSTSLTAAAAIFSFSNFLPYSLAFSNHLEIRPNRESAHPRVSHLELGQLGEVLLEGGHATTLQLLQLLT